MGGKMSSHLKKHLFSLLKNVYEFGLWIKDLRYIHKINWNIFESCFTDDLTRKCRCSVFNLAYRGKKPSCFPLPGTSRNCTLIWIAGRSYNQFGNDLKRHWHGVSSIQFFSLVPCFITWCRFKYGYNLLKCSNFKVVPCCGPHWGINYLLELENAQ